MGSPAHRTQRGEWMTCERRRHQNLADAAMAWSWKKRTRLPAERGYDTCAACLASDDGLTERQKGMPQMAVHRTPN